MKTSEIESLIEAGLPESQATVEGDGTHFNALIICPAFEGQSRIKRQQMVYDTVRAQLLDGSLHALSLKAMTPGEWQTIENIENKE